MADLYVPTKLKCTSQSPQSIRKNLMLFLNNMIWYKDVTMTDSIFQCSVVTSKCHV